MASVNRIDIAVSRIDINRRLLRLASLDAEFPRSLLRRQRAENEENVGVEMKNVGRK